MELILGRWRMADKRMFAKDLVTSDAFTDMSLSTQALYFHLSILADDDGFVVNPKRIRSMIGASDDDLKHLIEKGYIIPFRSGIVVITHWRHNNNLRKDRYRPSTNEERAQLRVMPGGIYSIDCNSGIPLVDHRYTQNSIDKNRIVKNRIEDDDDWAATIHTRIDYDGMCTMLDIIGIRLLNEVIDDMVDVYTTSSDTIHINGHEFYSASHVRARYDTIDADIMLHIIGRLRTANIGTDARAYIRTTTYNATKTIDTQYNADARHGR